MTIEEIAKNKNMFQGLKFDKIYLGRNIKVLSQSNENLVFETYLYAGDTKNITHKIKVKDVLNAYNNILVQAICENQAILDGGIIYQDFLDIVPLSSVKSVENEQFLEI